MAEPTKQEIVQVFKRLRAIGPNKACFDCGAKNPTWSSVTYGVYLCIDCSAVHRSLGVHLSFVRSTQLDSWTWIQLRCMQVGGNANATAYFRSHGCNTKEAHVKYNSRAANMYREKLQSLAVVAQKNYGRQLFIDTSDPQLSPTGTEDFFAAMSTDKSPNSSSTDLSLDMARVSVSNSSTKPDATVGTEDSEMSRQPSVDTLHATKPVTKPETKSLINKRKPATKLGLGGGGGGGLGAHKVNRSFSEIEKQAEDEKEKQKKGEIFIAPNTPETKDDGGRISYSGSLAMTDKKLASLDPKKAAQAERLGMGFGRSGQSTGSHSASSSMNTIDQVTPVKTSSSSYKEPSSRSFSGRQQPRQYDIFDDYGIGDHSSSSTRYDPPDYGSSRYDDHDSYTGAGIGSTRTSKHSAFADNPSHISSSSSSRQSSSSHSTTVSTGYKGYSNGRQQSSSSSSSGDVKERFGSAKAISSDQYFNRDRQDTDSIGSYEKFSGSKSISSDDYFGRPARQKGQDMSGLSDSVSKVSSKLASAANGVWGSFQDTYHNYRSN